MQDEPRLPRRKSPRLRAYDYAACGSYFVTICAHHRRCLFGSVNGGTMLRNDVGEIVAAAWLRIPARRPHVELDAWVVMPNHFHAIVGIRRAGSDATLMEIVGAFKSETTRAVNALRGVAGAPLWQRSFYEHVIRDDADLLRVQEYIAGNPASWAKDRENPEFDGGPRAGT